MLLTILLYSAFTGLSALSVGFWDFAFYRFLTGLGVGGEFAVGVALVAEVMPNTARPLRLGFAASAVGRRQCFGGGDQHRLGRWPTRGSFRELGDRAGIRSMPGG